MTIPLLCLSLHQVLVGKVFLRSQNVYPYRLVSQLVERQHLQLPITQFYLGDVDGSWTKADGATLKTTTSNEIIIDLGNAITEDNSRLIPIYYNGVNSRIREHGFKGLDEVKDAYMELDGMISVIGSDKNGNQPVGIGPVR